ncbi:hypothetical protein Amico_0948 [Aminobacterium colombiense DSM 12261]|uniref:Uncharacterized protein n=1 Tax=Aminobacterium colombiense (strain DSM 12261 / ALA-1) TaxID=572547 RepID=D5EEU1_AMICL|nr:hypothetical protein Amico_0948 [Aminobacterium colombiense DSM 12261]
MECLKRSFLLCRLWKREKLIANRFKLQKSYKTYKGRRDTIKAYEPVKMKGIERKYDDGSTLLIYENSEVWVHIEPHVWFDNLHSMKPYKAGEELDRLMRDNIVLYDEKLFRNIINPDHYHLFF